ncbi:MAG: hypothetical protein KAX49_04455 [Halanaerobiales bacterium]|nr:hypothetical protein [Halanaerobiales bacterium]
MILKILKVITWIILTLTIFFTGYLAFMTITDYKPDVVIPLEVENNQQSIVESDITYSMMIFNIGYCGLDKGRDFFMDGGTESRSESKEKTLENLYAATEFIKGEETSFILLQEVDINSTRSFHVNEYAYLQENLKDYSSTFAYNYKVPWVPVPITKPHGTVNSGLVTFSKYNINETNRYQYPGDEKWLRQLAMLDRCFIESRIKIDENKELVILNSHLSAYDKGGFIRVQQLGFLKEYIITEYEKGNYVIVAGDWNHQIPGTDLSVFQSERGWPEWLQKIPEDFKPEGFNWVADRLTPTDRSVERPYEKGKNFLSIIDGFLVSDNIEVKSVKGYSLEFEYTDHNPVKMEFLLK